jgi:thiamine biosynthesis lipoprotein
MGTFVAIDAEAASDTVAQQGVEAAFAAILAVQQLMHPTRGIDLAALAVCVPGAPLRVHRWTWETLDLCRQLHQASLGAFDPCLAEVPGRMADLELRPGDTLMAHAPMRVDLGGIAKGYAVDRAVDALRAAGCIGGLVNAGGDLAAFGRRSHRIVCCGPDTPGVLLELRDAALATSDARADAGARTMRPAEHRGYYHGGDRRLPASGRVTVMAPRAALADGLTKCLLSAERELGAGLLGAFGAKQIRYPQPSAQISA